MKKFSLIPFLFATYSIFWAQQRQWIKVDEQFHYVVLEENSKEKLLPESHITMDLIKKDTNDQDVDLATQKPINTMQLTYKSVSDRIGKAGLQNLKKNSSYLIKYTMGFEGNAYRIEIEHATTEMEQIEELKKYLYKNFQKQQVIKGSLSHEVKSTGEPIKKNYTTFTIPATADIKAIQEKFNFIKYTKVKAETKNEFVKITT